MNSDGEDLAASGKVEPPGMISRAIERQYRSLLPLKLITALMAVIVVGAAAVGNFSFRIFWLGLIALVMGVAALVVLTRQRRVPSGSAVD